MTDFSVLHTASAVSLVILIISMFVVFIRLQRGPTLPDRIISLDVFSTLTIGIIAAYTVYTGNPVFLDASVIVAVITFLGTVAIARYLERRR